jgi:hypothetical protein
MKSNIKLRYQGSHNIFIVGSRSFVGGKRLMVSGGRRTLLGTLAARGTVRRKHCFSRNSRSGNGNGNEPRSALTTEGSA